MITCKNCMYVCMYVCLRACVSVCILSSTEDLAIYYNYYIYLNIIFFYSNIIYNRLSRRCRHHRLSCCCRRHRLSRRCSHHRLSCRHHRLSCRHNRLSRRRCCCHHCPRLHSLSYTPVH